MFVTLSKVQVSQVILPQYLLKSLSVFFLTLRYSLTEEGLALAERLESVEKGDKDAPEGDREESRSEGEEGEEEEGGDPGVVDLTGSDEDDEEKEEDRIQ